MTSATYLEAVRAARRQGQRQLAWAHLKAGQALDPEGSLVGLALEEADLLSVEGRPEAAREVLLIALKGHPRNAWVPRGLADLAHREGDIANAWLYLKQAQALDPEGQRWSRDIGPVVKVDQLVKEMIQNDETKEPFTRFQGQGCA